MHTVTTVQDMQRLCREIRANGTTLGFVPTMGALHAGHLSLVQRSTAECGATAVSLFVNPLQFAPGEDLAAYPRTLDQDRTLLDTAGVDILFAPTPEEMYPPNATTTVYVGGASTRLDGASRPTHFKGVTTVVAKLFHIVAPHRAYFGQKDAAQIAVLRAMVRDLNFDLQLIPCPIVRDLDGLALSSRNRYLSAAERGQSLVIRRCLLAIERHIAAGARTSDALIDAGLRELATEPAAKVDYLAIVNPDTLEPVAHATPGTLVAAALWISTTRLIDNFIVP
jgi:pantoate--beta-alanine ligase